ncbi:MAG: ester cyclase [Pseudomonadota bacterium]
MSPFSRVTAAVLLAFALSAGSAVADDRSVVEAFYAQLLSAPAPDDLDGQVRDVVAEDWVSIPTPRGGEGAEGLVKTLKFFYSIIPDLKWTPQEILQVGNRYVVRSTATGTPTGKFFGIEPKAGFEIMTIDIHEVVDGRIVRSYHVEDWARAIRQVSGSGH